MDESKRDLDDDLDAGLAAAFGDTSEPGTSILKRIERLTGVTSQILLHDNPDEESPLTHVHRLTRDDEGAEDDSRYQIAGEIAKGGIGVVYKCRDRDLGRDVAVKVLRKVHAGNPEVFHRFVEEAQIGGQLQHPGIVPVYSLGLQPDGRPSFAMKLVKGRTLAAALKERKSPAEDRRTLLRVFERICLTMAYAHARGVIHRDLKPSNVMLGAFGVVLVVDWGFGKVLGRPEREEQEAEKTIVTTVRSEHEGSASIAGSVMGTPAYMPPEQALGHVAELDEQTDVFSLGAILCEILTGQPPYIGEAKDLLVLASQAKLDDAFDRLENCDADPEVAALAKCCLSPLRGDRPANAGEVANDMARLLTEAEERAHAAKLTAVKERARVKQARSHAAWERKAKQLTIGIAAAVLVLIAGGGVFFFQQDAKARKLAATARPMVEQALEEACRLAGQEKWGAAIASIEKAEYLATDLDAAVRCRVRVARSRTEATRDEALAAAAQAERDKRLLAELAAIRADQVNLSPDLVAMDARWRAAFSEYGVDVESGMPEEIGALVRSRGERFATQVAEALDSWSVAINPPAAMLVSGPMVVQMPSKTEGITTDTERLRAIAETSNPDPRLNELRSLIAERDAEGLSKLAAGDDVLDLPPGSLMRLAQVLGAMGSTKERRELLERALRRYPGDANLHQFLAGVLWTEDREASYRHYTAALAIMPENARLHSRLGTFLASDPERKMEADFHTRRGIDLDPDDWFTQESRGTWHQVNRRWAESIRCWRKAHQLAPDNALVLLQLGSALSSSDPTEAELLLKKAIHRMPNMILARISLIRLLTSWCRYDEAIEAIEAARKVIELHSDYDNFRSVWATALNRTGRREEQLQFLRRWVEQEHDSPNAHRALGNSLMWRGQFDDALPHLERAVALGDSLLAPPLIEQCREFQYLSSRLPALINGDFQPADADESLKIARTCHLGKRYASASRFYEQALAGDPAKEREYGLRAACNAALAGTGKGVDRELLTDEERTECRRLAFRRVSECVKANEGMSEGWRVALFLTRLLHDGYLDCVRAPRELAKLPPDEQAAWEQLWDRVQKSIDAAWKED